MLKNLFASLLAIFLVTSATYAEKATVTKVKFVTSQEVSNVLASNLIGEYVKNKSGETIGHINDLVFDDKQNLNIAVIGVGGFLGIGEKDVAVPFETLTVTPQDNNQFVITANLDKTALENAPSFKRLNDQKGGVMKKMSEWGNKAKEAAKQAAETTKKAYDNAKENLTNSENKETQ